ncbi:MAG: 23S rRNA (uracil(1939)-C(5))-methyltransferase RlmD [Planctomycetota bacterium]
MPDPRPDPTLGLDPAAAAAPAPARKPRRGDLLDVLVEGIDHRGVGLARAGDATLKLRFATPGSRVRARVLRRGGKGRYDAAVEEVTDPGPHAAEQHCDHAGLCGGCAQPRTAYGEELRQKRRLVEEALVTAWREAELDGADALLAAMPDVLGAERLWGYRNKMDFTFGNRRFVPKTEPEGAEADFALGLHVPRFHQKVLDVTGCAIAFDGASALVNSMRELSRAAGLEPWDLRNHAGLLRHLVVRRGFRTGETMVDLVTSARAADRVDPLVAELLVRHPEITTVVQNVTTRQATVAYGEEEHVLHGPGHIEEILSGRRFRISADSFFQTNTEAAERLFGVVAEFAALGDGGVLFDLYCGAGTIGLAIGEGAARVVGFESVPSAVRDARANAAANGFGSAEYHEGDVLETMARAADERTPDVVVVDPPRAGLHPKVPAKIAALMSPRIVVVSCNPRTGTRDVAALVREGYAVRAMRPVDLFPHTPHVELVFQLERVR